MDIERTDDEIDEVINKCCDSEDDGKSAWPAMSYEQGVKAALLWVTGQHNDNPMEDE